MLSQEKPVQTSSTRPNDARVFGAHLCALPGRTWPADEMIDHRALKVALEVVSDVGWWETMLRPFFYHSSRGNGGLSM